MPDQQEAAPQARNRHSFQFKLAGALLLVIVADLLFYMERAGSTLGLFALTVLALIACLRGDMFRRWPSRLAFASALLFALALAADPSLLSFVLYWTALTLAVLLPRTAAFDNGWRWLQRLFFHLLIVNFGPFRDWVIARKAKARRGPTGFGRGALALVLPAIGSIVFIALFAEANPVIDDALAQLDFGAFADENLVLRIAFWAAAFIGAWSLLRPARVVLRPADPDGDWAFDLPGVSLASVTLSLLAFNAIFVVQNGLDAAFLWSGARLPDGMTLAEYAHRGAYPLIATALLAGLFVLITLRPGTASAASGPIRLLVTLWIAQNLMLVASTMLRTFDYIDAYSLTRLRIAALIWMGLVAVGLALICYRLLRGKTGGWLINANMLAALIVLGVCSAVDLGRMAAAWNVRHAREVGGRGTAIDLCYLNTLGPSALLPLIELESRPLPTELRKRVAWLRAQKFDELTRIQADWHGWTWRGARRLAAARAQIEARHLGRPAGGTRQCDGRPFPPPPPPPPPPPALEVPPNENGAMENEVAHAAPAPKPLTGRAQR